MKTWPNRLVTVRRSGKDRVYIQVGHPNEPMFTSMFLSDSEALKVLKELGSVMSEVLS